MKTLTFIFCLVVLVSVSKAQDSTRTEVLEDIHIKFELPRVAWSEAQVKQTKSESTIYTYTRKLAEKKKAGQATLSILVEHIKPSTSLRDYSTKGMQFFQKQNGFKLKKTFVDTDGRFTLPYTIGYEAEYLDAQGQKHHLYILHTIEFNHGAQILIDFPYEQYFLYEEEQSQIIRSLRYER
ncbi:MAG: hypothetical protein K0R51_2224 [Cytophagaceae bacterium]|jgi:hypothetical protein|nr:hypothetical protein [Cytophagaceae bacterium]